ncbi:MAG: hypothetical protein ABJB10_16765 [Mesorhizobium sp.]
MTLTFTVESPNDRQIEHQTALRGDGDLLAGLPVGEAAPVVGGQATSLLGRLWRFASNLPSHLHGRRRLPPEDDYLRRDIGLSERDIQREYWQYYWWGQ